MGDPAAFFSYVRADDEHDGGYLTDLRKRLASEVRMQTGVEFLIFQDREDIMWGQRWQARIDRSIDATTLLIAVITPGYLRSQACRDEVAKFLEREKTLGRDDLILPIYYVETPGLADVDDEIASELSARQRVDWRDLRFEGFDQPQARKALAALARQIVQALSRETSPATVVVPPTTDDDDDAPGFVELIAEAEDAFPLFSDAINAFAEEMNEMTALSEVATADLDTANASSKPASARLVRIHQFAGELEGPAANMEVLAEDYVEQLARIDGGLAAMAERIPELEDEDEITAVREFYVQIKSFADVTREGLESLWSVAKAARKTGKISKTVRPVLGRISRAVEKIVPSQQTFDRWVHDFEVGLQQLDARDGN